MASKSNVRYAYVGLIVATLLVCSTAALAQFTANIREWSETPAGPALPTPRWTW